NRGIVYSQKMLINLMDKGLSRMQAYDIVQKVALEVINKSSSFRDEAIASREIGKFLKKAEVEAIFNPYSYLVNVDKIYKRFSLK
ncbi:MAG: adenylosuccinate lyase, partial [Candidatus Susulua stagnicola]|nr:adenylosuccinate lyase [Candidatus Susulua stagnicola]